MARTAKRKKSTSRKKAKSSVDPVKKYTILGVFCVAILVAGYISYKKYLSGGNSFESSKYVVKGIDLSHHNPILNWDIVSEQGISFAYMKATEGTTHIDRNYKFNYQPARKANVYVGTYHFYSFALSGKEQARHFIKNGQFNKGDMIPAIDVEHSPINLFSKDNKYVALVVSELKILENELYEHFGVHPIIYTNRDCYKLYIKGNFANNLIWMCDLQGEPSDKVPWRIWQFSHKGKVPGIPDEVDLNYYRYSFGEFNELLLP